eukprot:1166797-Prymnesium_polylepis.1
MRTGARHADVATMRKRRRRGASDDGAAQATTARRKRGSSRVRTVAGGRFVFEVLLAEGVTADDFGEPQARLLLALPLLELLDEHRDHLRHVLPDMVESEALERSERAYERGVRVWRDRKGASTMPLSSSRLPEER